MKTEVEIRSLANCEMHPELLATFQHHQHISEKWVNLHGQWERTISQEQREWDCEKRKWIVAYMGQQLARGGGVFGAFHGLELVGFCCVDGTLHGKYANLTMLFIHDNWQRKRIGKRLFSFACDHARGLGADKLFISAIPSTQTVAFYQSMGCTDAHEVVEEFVDSPADRYLECELRS